MWPWNLQLTYDDITLHRDQREVWVDVGIRPYFVWVAAREALFWGIVCHFGWMVGGGGVVDGALFWAGGGVWDIVLGGSGWVGGWMWVEVGVLFDNVRFIPLFIVCCFSHYSAVLHKMSTLVNKSFKTLKVWTKETIRTTLAHIRPLHNFLWNERWCNFKMFVEKYCV